MAYGDRNDKLQLIKQAEREQWSVVDKCSIEHIEKPPGMFRAVLIQLIRTFMNRLSTNRVTSGSR